jgi:hypothetical protein
VLVVHTCNPSYSGGRDLEDLGSRPRPAQAKKTKNKKNKSETLSQKRTDRMFQMVQLMPNKYAVLSSNSGAKKERKKEKRF